ncbi:hypothetical protein [Paraburkholderia sp. J67]|uniref:hypothetical protein n=1 Tax=Paraburkholderia sp. J67 TaxID=2805435 RepID=UPI002ABD8982|nr:hypothetical protein [Paraburkholderia sp. J67]
MKHRRTGVVIGGDWQPDGEDLPFTFSQVEARVNPTWAAERAAQGDAFAQGRRIQVAKRTPQKSGAAGVLKVESGKGAPRKRGSASANG